MRNFVITSESVSAGHPDKLCDQVSDAVVDACLASGHRTGLIAECALATGVVFLSVRAGAELRIDPAHVAREVIAAAGYPGDPEGQEPTVILDLSYPAALGSLRADQMVTAFGYACGETQDYMPYPIWAAHRLVREIDTARQEGRLDWISADAQAQVAARFADRHATALEAVAFRFGTTTETSDDQAIEALLAEVVARTFADAPVGPSDSTRFVAIGDEGPAGPLIHSGLTGRKSADDAYGAFVRRAGPSLSGKDPSRIDRIANYAARHAALNVQAAGLAQEIEVQLSYVIGDAAPVSVEVDSFGSATVPDSVISARLRDLIDFRAEAIAERMGLWDLPAARGGRFYRDLAVYGHFGRSDIAPPWEALDLAGKLA